MASKKISLYALIIASYTAISILLGSFSFGMIQIRIAELLMILCIIDKQFITPLTLACFVTNLIGIFSGTNPMVLDLIIGTLATLLSGIMMHKLRNIKLFNQPLLSLLMPVIFNGLMVGYEIYYYLDVNLYLSIIYVSVGELLSVTALGLLFLKPISKVIEEYME